MTRIRVAVVLVLATMLAFASPAGAQADSFTISLDGVIRGQAEGDIVELVDQAVAPALVGATCTVTGATENNGSVHPGNNVIIATGDATATVPGVEDVPGQVVVGSGSLVLGSNVVVSLEFGPDGITSGGVALAFDCAAAAPVGPVETGAGGTAADGGNQLAITLVVLGGAAIVGSGALLGWKRSSTLNS